MLIGSKCIDGRKTIAGAKARLLQEPFVTVKDRERNGQRTAPRTFPKNAIFGDGEMARLTRAFDWSRTPVGPIQRHGGTLAVRSSPRPGHSRTVFTLFLPFEAVAH